MTQLRPGGPAGGDCVFEQPLFLVGRLPSPSHSRSCQATSGRLVRPPQNGFAFSGCTTFLTCDIRTAASLLGATLASNAFRIWRPCRIAVSSALQLRWQCSSERRIAQACEATFPRYPTTRVGGLFQASNRAGVPVCKSQAENRCVLAGGLFHRMLRTRL
jgi:hypothetical protein